MARTLTVKGIGKASVKPDQVEIRFSLEAKDKNYDMAMTLAAEQISRISTALEQADFEKDSLKTVAFDVQAVYDNVRDKYQNYTRVFEGYKCCHTLKLLFDFDFFTLSRALHAIAKSRVNPEIRISFTVKDPDAMNALILQDAATNARQKAGILCHASGVTLGNLVNIHYNWNEVSFVSRTVYDYDSNCIAVGAAPCNIEINPDDINAADSAAFMWEIL